MNSCIVCNSTKIRTREFNKLRLFECIICGLLWRQTFDVPLSYYDDADPKSSPERREARLRNTRDRVDTFFHSVPKTGVCDVGTGEGTFLLALGEAGGSGVGIEPGAKYIAEAKKNGIRIEGKTYEDVPKVIAMEHVQTLTLFHVIEHVERPDQMLQLFYNALPPGGHVIIETPTMSSPVLRAARFNHPLIYPEHLYYFNDNNLRQLLEHTGFATLAEGRRDFDQYAMPIRESLRRLLRTRAGKPQPLPPASYAGTLREHVRLYLARRVVASGRLNYAWVVAQKI